MNISIFGLGYVGTVSLGCLAKQNHNVIGVDINKRKVDAVNNGKSTIVEPYLDGLVKYGVKNKKIIATKDFIYAVKNTDVSFVCIGTPGRKDGNLNLNSLFNSLEQIAEGIKFKNTYHTIVIRSTVHPGSFNRIIGIVEKYSVKKNKRGFCVIINPEFLREGSAVKDFFNPPVNIIGTKCMRGAEILKRLYRFNKAPAVIVNENVAELIKLISNAFHSAKIAFANEIGNLCKKLNVNPFEIMKLFSLDTKLNISPVYLKPGFAFGGSCLPKDLKALNKIAGNNSVKLPLISSIVNSNELQKKLTYDLIKKLGMKKIGIWGLSFKIGTDDLRGSPILDVANMLIKNGFHVKLYDRNVVIKNLIGANKSYLFKKLPNVKNLIVKNFDGLLNHADVLVVNSYDNKMIRKIKKKKNCRIIDLVYSSELVSLKNYYGLCW